MSEGQVLIDETHLVGRRIRQTFHGRGKHPDIAVEIEVDDSEHWRVVRIETTARDILSATISDVPVTDLAAAALARQAWVRSGSSAQFAFEPRNDVAAFASMRARRKRRSGAVDLGEVAAIYREATEAGDRAPVERVREKLDIARSTAGRYVAQARRANLLPATTRGKVQA